MSVYSRVPEGNQGKWTLLSLKIGGRIEFLFFQLQLLGKKVLRTLTVIWDRISFLEAEAVREKALLMFYPYVG